ncbi:CapA family protein [Streptomyces sp. NPDC002004]
MHGEPLTLFLAGDVMLGRGVDQILPHPGDPVLREAYVKDARTYVELAESVNGPIPQPVDFRWPWGDALDALDEAAPHVRIVNLETGVTRSDDFAPGKEVHYRMTPDNLPALAVARPDVCVLANNHVLDFGRRGLMDTLDALADAALRTAGAGPDATAALRPATVPVDAGHRVLVLACSMATSGVPRDWAATAARSGVAYISRPSAGAAADLAARARRTRRPGDIVVVSVHWGPNWGYDLTPDEVRFAHALVEGGVDVVHGHSSHHPRPVEVHRGRLILYGCGDLIDDYEGITGYERYRDDLRLLHLVRLDPDDGALRGLRMVPLQAHRMRLRHASTPDRAWLCATLDRVSARYATHVEEADGALALRWGA